MAKTTGTKIIKLHFDHGMLDAEEKTFWKTVNKLAKANRRVEAGLSKGEATLRVLDRFYRLPAAGPSHPGGRPRSDLSEEILRFMRERRAQGKTSGAIVKE